ncbi:MAG: DUF3810 domain-containing protein [Ruminococcaceae bacterium]|nr:DUF3810 domain-containing protein [Oscillospiraceae bacterium]
MMKYRQKKKKKGLVIAGFCSLALIPIFIFLNILLKSCPYFTEKYIVGIFHKYISGAFGFVTNFLPFSLCELLIIALPVILIILFIRAYRKTSVTNSLSPLVRLLSGLCALVSLLFCIFTTGLSFNYSRVKTADTLELDTSNPQKEELADALEYIIEELNVLCQEIEFDQNGISKYKDGFLEMSKQGNKSFDILAQQNRIFSGLRVRAKPMLISSIVMNYMGTTGVYSPFTYEANVNILFPDFSLPQTMCHEIAHLRGFMPENEAEFVGYLACINSDDIYFNYSGYMYAFNCVRNALYKTDKQLYSQLMKTVNPYVKSEWQNYFDYADKFETKVTEISNAVNNSYLISQGQSDGIISYSKAVILIIAQMRKDNIVGM